MIVCGPGGAVRIESGLDGIEFREATEIDRDLDDLGLTSEEDVGTSCNLDGTCAG